ncbi:MAG: carbohydrate porin, partial [Endomicrobium sp.]|nr:carbohydrate porin [Endomicrobium sp.]
LGFAIGQISGDCVLKSNNIDNFKYGKETQIELYYKYKINDNISIIANLQYLANLKGGNTSYNHDTVVIGIRTLIAF